MQPANSKVKCIKEDKVSNSFLQNGPEETTTLTDDSEYGYTIDLFVGS